MLTSFIDIFLWNFSNFEIKLLEIVVVVKLKYFEEMVVPSVWRADRQFTYLYSFLNANGIMLTTFIPLRIRAIYC